MFEDMHFRDKEELEKFIAVPADGVFTKEQISMWCYGCCWWARSVEDWIHLTSGACFYRWSNLKKEQKRFLYLILPADLRIIQKDFQNADIEDFDLDEEDEDGELNFKFKKSDIVSYYNWLLSESPLHRVALIREWKEDMLVPLDVDADTFAFHHFGCMARLPREHQAVFDSMVRLRRYMTWDRAYLAGLYLRKIHGNRYSLMSQPVGHAALDDTVDKTLFNNFINGVVKKKGTSWRNNSEYAGHGRIFKGGRSARLRLEMEKLPGVTKKEGDFGIITQVVLSANIPEFARALNELFDKWEEKKDV